MRLCVFCTAVFPVLFWHSSNISCSYFFLSHFLCIYILVHYIPLHFTEILISYEQFIFCSQRCFCTYWDIIFQISFIIILVNSFIFYSDLSVCCCNKGVSLVWDHSVLSYLILVIVSTLLIHLGSPLHCLMYPLFCPIVFKTSIFKLSHVLSVQYLYVWSLAALLDFGFITLRWLLLFALVDCLHMYDLIG